MINIQTIENVSDCLPLYLPQSLYLKPLAKFNISVALPLNKTGKSISNLEVMDKLSAAMKPDKFLLLRVSKSTVEFLRFEAELENRKKLRMAIDRLDGTNLRISGFSELFRVRASEFKDEFPTRHDWDAFFRDANNMDEMKPGERPDTIHISHLPIRWFCPRQNENEEQVKPSESIFKRIFEKFGSVRCVDIPICDAYRTKMNTDINGMRTFSIEQDVLFEAYVQFDEYVGFVRAMDEFRGMKLVRKFVDKTQAINIKVNFDRSKHLSEASIMRRERMRKRLLEKAKAEEERLERLKREEEERLERERQMQREKEEQQRFAELEKKRQREEARKQKHMKKIQERSEQEYAQKIRVEERKLKIAQRKLESIRILGAVFSRIKEKYIESMDDKPSTSAAVNPAREEMRVRLVEKYKDATEKLVIEQRKKVQEMKSKTPLQGLLQSVNKKIEAEESRKALEKVNTSVAATPANVITTNTEASGMPINPFKAMAAAASEWMESMGGMFPYMPPMLPGMAAPFRPTGYMGMRGMIPNTGYRGMGRPRGRYFGRGRGGYDPPFAHSYRHHNNEEYESNGEAGAVEYQHRHHSATRYPRGFRGGYMRGGKDHYKKKHSHRHHRSRSRSSSYSRSRSRSHSRGRSRHYSKRSRSRSRSRSYYTQSRSHSHSRSRSQRSSKKLVSTRRSRTTSYSSSSRSRSRSHRRHSHRHSSRRRSRRNSEHSSSRRSHRRRSVVLETEELVRSAEVIKRTIETDMQTRMRQEEREIKENFRTSKSHGNQLSSASAGTPNANNEENQNGQFDDDENMQRRRRSTSVDDAHIDQSRHSKSRSSRRSFESERHDNTEHHQSKRNKSRDISSGEDEYDNDD